LSNKITIGELKSLLLKEVTDLEPFYLYFNMYNDETLEDLEKRMVAHNVRHNHGTDI
jgi:hypothetical protein